MNPPLVAALRRSALRRGAPFHTPGHQRGQGAPDLLREAWGSQVWQWDLPELPGLDNLFNPTGPIAAAQTFAAQVFGADRTWFLVNGSTAGVIAAILATCGPGDKLLLPRNAHRSAIAGLIWSGAVPIFVNPPYDPDWDLGGTLTPAQVAQALAQHPDLKAVLVLSPTYQGVGADLAAIAALTQAHGIPLLVDEAHGAHWGFHPALPPRALSQGADLAVQSIHKTLGSLTQSAMVHTRGDRVCPQRLSQALALLQSSSPSYLLLASLDAACHQLATAGEALMAGTLALANRAGTALAQVPGVRVWGGAEGRSGFWWRDPTRLTVGVGGLGLSGFEADEWLAERGIIAELPSVQHLTFIVSLGHGAADIEQLVAGFWGLSASRAGADRSPLQSPPAPILPDQPYSTPVLSPREAFFAPIAVVPWAAAIGHPSADCLCPYPPGIPLLFPGEVISRSALDTLQHIQAEGGIITGCADATLATLRIVDRV